VRRVSLTISILLPRPPMSAISFRPESREEAITHFHNLLRQHHIQLASELATSATSPSPTPFQPFVAAAEDIWAEVAHVLEPLLEGEDTRDASRLALLTVFKEDALDAAVRLFLLCLSRSYLGLKILNGEADAPYGAIGGGNVRPSGFADRALRVHQASARLGPCLYAASCVLPPHCELPHGLS
jgi:hypothetical protein